MRHGYNHSHKPVLPVRVTVEQRQAHDGANLLCTGHRCKFPSDEHASMCPTMDGALPATTCPVVRSCSVLAEGAHRGCQCVERWIKLCNNTVDKDDHVPVHQDFSSCPKLYEPSLNARHNQDMQLGYVCVTFTTLTRFILLHLVCTHATGFCSPCRSALENETDKGGCEMRVV